MSPARTTSEATPVEASPAEVLYEATRRAVPVAQLTATRPITVAEAYEIQREGHLLRLGHGESDSGVKLGFTSRAKMVQMGVSGVIAGRLTIEMRVADGAELALGGLIHPRIEPELAYLLAADIDPDDPRAPAPDAVAAVAPALEVIDSRYRDFSFTLADVIADNASSARYVIGPWRAPGSDLGNRAVQMRVAGQTVQIGSTAAILGHPGRALPALVALSRSAGIPLRAGQVVLAGAATEAVPLLPGLAECEVAGLGRATVRVVRHA